MSTALDAHEALRRLAGSGELATFCAGHDLDLLVVFGSAIRGTGTRQPHDLDVAVLARGAGGERYFALVADLVALVHSDALDVMDLARAGILARAEALGGGEPLYERRPGVFAEEQMRAMGQRMESGWLFDLQLAVLAGR